MLELLCMQGCEVRGARNGAVALALTAQWLPHLVLMDLGLPGLDGFAVARRVLDLKCHPRPLIAAVTGWDTDEVRQRAAACGIDSFMVKPASWEQLAGLVRAVHDTASTAES